MSSSKQNRQLLGIRGGDATVCGLIAVNESSSQFDSVKKQYHGIKCYWFALIKNVAPPPPPSPQCGPIVK